MEMNTRQNDRMQSNNKRKRQHRHPEQKEERALGRSNKKTIQEAVHKYASRITKTLTKRQLEAGQ